jgi:hypothetical protein
MSIGVKAKPENKCISLPKIAIEHFFPMRRKTGLGYCPWIDWVLPFLLLLPVGRLAI